MRCAYQQQWKELKKLKDQLKSKWTSSCNYWCRYFGNDNLNWRSLFSFPYTRMVRMTRSLFFVSEIWSKYYIIVLVFRNAGDLANFGWLESPVLDLQEEGNLFWVWIWCSVVYSIELWVFSFSYSFSHSNGIWDIIVIMVLVLVRDNDENYLVISTAYLYFDRK